MPPSRRHWIWLLGYQLLDARGEFEKGVSEWHHPVEKLNGIGGGPSATQRTLRGGRRGKGPRRTRCWPGGRHGRCFDSRTSPSRRCPDR
eukprot:7517351-Pyramimonas_sp.AAC.1